MQVVHMKQLVLLRCRVALLRCVIKTMHVWAWWFISQACRRAAIERVVCTCCQGTCTTALLGISGVHVTWE